MPIQAPGTNNGSNNRERPNYREQIIPNFANLLTQLGGVRPDTAGTVDIVRNGRDVKLNFAEFIEENSGGDFDPTQSAALASLRIPATFDKVNLPAYINRLGYAILFNLEKSEQQINKVWGLWSEQKKQNLIREYKRVAHTQFTLLSDILFNLSTEKLLDASHNLNTTPYAVSVLTSAGAGGAGYESDVIELATTADELIGEFEKGLAPYIKNKLESLGDEHRILYEEYNNRGRQLDINPLIRAAGESIDSYYNPNQNYNNGNSRRGNQQQRSPFEIHHDRGGRRRREKGSGDRGGRRDYNDDYSNF